MKKLIVISLLLMNSFNLVASEDVKALIDYWSQDENCIIHTHSIGQENIGCLGCQTKLYLLMQSDELSSEDDENTLTSTSLDPLEDDASVSTPTIFQKGDALSQVSSDPEDDRLLDGRHGCTIA